MISNQYTNEATDIIINTVSLIDSIKLDLNFLSMSVLTGNEKIKDDKFLFREEQAENLNKRIIELFDILKTSIEINKTELVFETHDLYYKLLKQLTQIYELAIQLFNQLSIPASILINGVIKKKDLFFGYKNLKSLMVNCENVYKLLAKQIDISINVKLIKGGVKEEIPLIGPNEELKDKNPKIYDLKSQFKDVSNYDDVINKLISNSKVFKNDKGELFFNGFKYEIAAIFQALNYIGFIPSFTDKKIAIIAMNTFKDLSLSDRILRHDNLIGKTNFYSSFLAKTN